MLALPLRQPINVDGTGTDGEVVLVRKDGKKLRFGMAVWARPCARERRCVRGTAAARAEPPSSPAPRHFLHATQISVGGGMYRYTKVVTLTPRYVVINETGIPLEVWTGARFAGGGGRCGGYGVATDA